MCTSHYQNGTWSAGQERGEGVEQPEPPQHCQVLRVLPGAQHDAHHHGVLPGEPSSSVFIFLPL